MNDPIKIAVLGNSHLASAKTGWEQIKDRYPGHALTFFGAPKDMMNDLELAEDVLRPQTNRLRNKLRRSSDGLEAILLPSYDAFILYGLEFGARRVIQLYRTHRPTSFEWREPLPRLLPMERCPDSVQMVSERLFDQAVMAGLRDSMGFRLTEQVVGATGAPTCLVAAPGFSEAVLDSGDWDGILGSDDCARLSQRFQRLAKATCPQGAQLILPRKDLTAYGLFTKRNAALNTAADGTPDFAHAAADYGAAMLQHALASLAEAPDMRAA